MDDNAEEGLSLPASEKEQQSPQKYSSNVNDKCQTIQGQHAYGL